MDRNGLPNLHHLLQSCSRLFTFCGCPRQPSSSTSSLLFCHRCDSSSSHRFTFVIGRTTLLYSYHMFNLIIYYLSVTQQFIGLVLLHIQLCIFFNPLIAFKRMSLGYFNFLAYQLSVSLTPINLHRKPPKRSRSASKSLAANWFLFSRVVVTTRLPILLRL